MHITARRPLAEDPRSDDYRIVDVWHRRHDAEPAYRLGCYATTLDPDVPDGTAMLAEALDAQGMVGADVMGALLELPHGYREVLARAMMHIATAAAVTAIVGLGMEHGIAAAEVAR